MANWIVQQLYGGAITTVIPHTFLDASMLRQVPDTQEVFVNSRHEGEHSDDGLGFDESIIVDLLQRVDEKDDKKALEVHLNEVSELNGTDKWKIIEHEQRGHVQTAIVVEKAYKWGKKSLEHTVVMCVGLLRLEQYETDALITVIVPVSSEPELDAMDKSISEESSVHLPPRITSAYSLLKDMVAAFKIVDPSLFV